MKSISVVLSGCNVKKRVEAAHECVSFSGLQPAGLKDGSHNRDITIPRLGGQVKKTSFEFRVTQCEICNLQSGKSYRGMA